MNNTVILATPRSGSNFLQYTMTSSSRMYKGGEFFTGGSNFNIYSKNHLRNIYQYYSHDYKTDHALEIYQRMFEIMGSGEKEHKDRDALGPEHLSLLLGFLKKHPQQTWSPSLKKYVSKDQLLIKAFYNHYNYENHFDIAEVMEMMDNVIVLYREDILKQFISWRVANKTNVWFLPKKHKPIKNVKLLWKLEDYLCFYKEQVKFYKDYKKHLPNFSHKKVVIAKYEDMDKKNYIKAIREILQSKDINCKLGESCSVKQSKPIDIADNFINKEKFLDDQPKIKDKLLLKIEDL